MQRCFTAFSRALGLALAVLCARADESFPTLQVGGVTYTNVFVTSHNATEIFFTHQGGMSNTRLRYLPPEVQQQYGYDAAIAKAIEKRRDDNRFTYQLIAAQNATIRANTARANRLFPAEAASNPVTLADPCSGKSLLGKTAPPLAVEKWFVEKPSETEGKFTLLFFYKSASEPCRRAIPALNELQRKFAGQLLVVGITTDDADDESLSLTCARGSDPKNLTAQAADINSLPSVLLVDAKNIVRYAGHPAALNDEEVLGKLLGQ